MQTVFLRDYAWNIKPYSLDKLTLVQLNPDMSCLCKQCISRSVGFWSTNWSGSALFAIKYVNLHQVSGSSNLIGWKLEMGVAT